MNNECPIRPQENIMNLGDRLLWGMKNYGGILNYEEQTGAISKPSISPRGNGHAVIVYNSTNSNYRLWIYVNEDWRGVELIL